MAKAKKTTKSQTPKTAKTREPEVRSVAAEIVEPEDEGSSEENSFINVDDSEIIDIDESDFEKEVDLPEVVESKAKKGPIKKSGKTNASSGGALAPADPIAAYLAEIRRYPLLTKEQERELAVRYRETGDAKAAEMLVTSNLRFVVKIAAEYSKFGAKLIDLVQEGNVGLMHAVKEFNPYKGVRLITYAVWWIRGYIQEYLMRQYSMVRIGTTQNQRKLFYRLQKEKQLLDSMGQEPNVKLLSSRLGVTEEEVETMTKRMSGRDVSLNQPMDDDSKTTLLDMESSGEPGIDEQIGHAEEIEVLRKGIDAIRDKLTEKEKFILEKRILSDEPLTLQEIGEHYGVTREAVRQIEARLINRIKSAFVANMGEAEETED